MLVHIQVLRFFAAVAVIAFHAAGVAPDGFKVPDRAISFALVFLGKVAAASFLVLYLAVVKGPKVRSAVVAVPLRSHSDLIVTATGHVISLIPGSLVVEVDRSTSTLYLHALNIYEEAGIAKIRQEVQNIEATLIRIMGTREELNALQDEPTPGMEGATL